MNNEESGAQVQGRGAAGEQPAAGSVRPAAAPERHWCHVVRPRRVRHRVRCHHLVLGVLRGVRGALRHAAAFQKSDLQSS